MFGHILPFPCSPLIDLIALDKFPNNPNNKKQPRKNPQILTPTSKRPYPPATAKANHSNGQQRQQNNKKEVTNLDIATEEDEAGQTVE